jgi:hypothetical protein
MLVYSAEFAVKMPFLAKVIPRVRLSTGQYCVKASKEALYGQSYLNGEFSADLAG